MDKWWEDEGFVKNGKVKLHYYAAGPQDGEPILLLHGFPQFAYEWRYHLPALAAQGYRVVAPDLRGYNLSDRPEKIEDYRISKLIGDVAAFYDEFGWQAANLVAHDWGGAISWAFAIFNPKRVSRFVAIDMPHPTAFRNAFQKPGQIRHSWYIWFIQTPEIPERVFGQDVAGFIRYMVYKSARPGTFSEEDMAAYTEVFSQPGQLEAAFNYYRANMAPERIYAAPKTKLAPLRMPVLLIHGQHDVAFSPRVWADSEQYCEGYFRRVELPGVGHWAPEEAPEETLRLILEHLKGQASKK